MELGRGIIWTWGREREREFEQRRERESRVCEEWNRLGDGIVSVGTVNVFKMRLGSSLEERDMGYL